MNWVIDINENVSIVISMTDNGSMSVAVVPESEKRNFTFTFREKYLFVGYLDKLVAYVDIPNKKVTYTAWEVKINNNVSIMVTRGLNDNINASVVPESVSMFCTWEKIGNFLFFKFMNQTFACIDLDSPKVIYDGRTITAAEMRNKAEDVQRSTADTKDNARAFEQGKNRDSDIPIRTELHTHFIEMLSGEKFLRLLLSYTDRIPMRGDSILGKMEKGERIEFFPQIYTSDSNFSFTELASQLSIDLDGQVSFSVLEEIINRRNVLVTMAARVMAERAGKNPKNSDDVAYYRAMIYIDLLRESLADLREQKIEYVEFSYSNPKTIIKMQNDIAAHPEEYAGIDFGFLFSLSRNATVASAVDRNMAGFEELVEQGKVKGFDLMGEEFGLTYADCYDFGDSKSFVSIVDRALHAMNGKNMVLRLHAGENKDSINNPYYSLLIIKILAMRFGYKLPQIRIGHAVHFTNTFNPEFKEPIKKLLDTLSLDVSLIDQFEKMTYADLLKDMGAIVEINATSNFTLSNIRNMNRLPYKWYVDNGIPMVLATDGAGMYLTDSLQEKFIALVYGGEKTLERVEDTESSVLSKR